MRLALAQINPTIGDLDANAALIRAMADQARDAGADLLVAPELALTGYPPKDLLLQQGFLDAVVAAATALGEQASAGLTLVFGAPRPLDFPRRAGRPGPAGRIANSLIAYREGRLLALYDKRLLPTYDVFDENRYFTPGSAPAIVEIDPAAGSAPCRVGLSICEDLWRGQDVGFADRYIDAPDPVAELIRPPDGSAGAQVIINPSASPFVLGKGQRHRDLLRNHARANGVHVAAVNQVGGDDELIFDGHAAVFDPKGRLIAAGPGFCEALTICDINPLREAPEVPDPLISTAPEELLFRALVLGVRDYARKTGFTSAVLGLSGGIDSAVVAVLAAAALGPASVLGVSMPSRYSSDGSKSDAHALAANLGVKIHDIPIETPFAAFLSTLAPAFAGKNEDVTEENLQSRVRGSILMALSNKFGHLLLTTGNKSELAAGYCTLYGDMNGGLAVLSDVTKILVYRLARWINANPRRLGITGLAAAPIPDASITKPPSAELRPNQTDQDSLPPYEVLDEIIERYVERREAPAAIAAAMAKLSPPVAPATIARMIRLIDLSEYKRKQAPIGLKVTGVAFGSGRRMPIAQRYRPEKKL